MVVEKNQVNNPETEPTDEGGQAVEPAPANEEGQSTPGTDAQDVEQPEGDSTTGEGKEEGEGKVTPEQYKKLQAEFTKKSQELANWNKLSQTKEFQDWYGNMTKEGQGQQEQFDPGKLGPEEKRAYDLITNNMVKPAVDAAVNQIRQEVQPFVNYVVNKQIDEFYSKYPDAKPHEKEIADVMMRHGHTMDEAWKYLKAGSAKEEAKQEVLKEISTKKDANLQRPGGRTATPTIKPGMSLKEIAKITSEQLGVEWD